MVESATGRPARIFISYRREETAYPAGWLYDRLRGRYTGQVFKDVDSIRPGDDFVQAITEAVASCHVLLALIALHVAAILFYRLRGKHLLKPMITGSGKAEPGVESMRPAKGWVALICLIAAIAVTRWVIAGAPPFG